VDAALLRTLVNDGYIPVVASVAADHSGQSLNVNADIAAGEARARPARPRAEPERSQNLGLGRARLAAWVRGSQGVTRVRPLCKAPV
jgi:hypothetical protein